MSTTTETPALPATAQASNASTGSVTKNPPLLVAWGSNRWLAGRLVRYAVKVLSLLLCLAAWHYAVKHKLDLKVINFFNVPAPLEVLESGYELVQTPKLKLHVINSLFRVFAGFLIAAFVGVTLGLLIGRSRWLEALLLPPLEVLRPIPGVAWIPLAILMFPSTEASMIFITFLGALFPILLNAIHGVEALDRRLIVASISLGAKPWSVFAEVILPGSLPSIITGLSIGMGFAGAQVK